MVGQIPLGHHWSAVTWSWQRVSSFAVVSMWNWPAKFGSLLRRQEDRVLTASNGSLFVEFSRRSGSSDSMLILVDCQHQWFLSIIGPSYLFFQSLLSGITRATCKEDSLPFGSLVDTGRHHHDYLYQPILTDPNHQSWLRSVVVAAQVIVPWQESWASSRSGSFCDPAEGVSNTSATCTSENVIRS